MSSVAAVAEVIEAFRQQGFEFVGKTDDGWFKLRGLLIPPGADRGCQCEVQLDPTFFDLPRIRLLDIPSELPKAVPHLGADGGLCYLAKGTVVLDIYDPIGQSLACLQLAAAVLGQILKGEMIEDLAEEFFAYWNGWLCFVDMQGEDLGRQNCIVAQANGNPLWFITDNGDRTKRKLNSLGYQATDKTILTYRVKTTAQPRPLTSHWPPETVGDVLAWQGTLDPRCRRKIHDRIKEGENKKANGVLIVIESPLMTYGFAVLFDRQALVQKSKLAKRKDSSYGLKVMLVSMIRIDDRYLTQRNIPKSKTLADKRIALVGCGTIGGYLSDMLVKAGAGTRGGKLTLVDFDCLLPQNIGRHRLGFPDLLSNKAEAMSKELIRMSPGAEIHALSVDVRQAQLGQLDLLIDATGEESLGHWLCGRYRAPTPMLSVWIEGPGTAVRALLRTNSSGACYRCLWHSHRRDELRSTLNPLPTMLAGHGCEGLYVPFPASVSVQAASLGAEMALDWINGVHSPALQTRLLDRTHQLATPDCDPLRDRECPICNS
ncbi:ThiF family adenylyltransferase [Xylophilus ampelinus]|uniref:Molybdopterin/thiamine biosynthesis adenylyltransferase n=1 Tax=Xylophilus ampelinus TaxID=54067 RepID=A0A318SJ85_9BURK|nr:ThiF family adenylyltransferase [Xylophilus ampelinus]MCS4509963.1 ThiF family adenylyltransferase [Xylophilus ampelinus]PYE78458.1 molybdopterin/thiamine biosynthesis adenylyltransferase [Xylophilus ampelinus]